MSKKNPRPIPMFDHPIIETHCHLDYLEGEDLFETITKSKQHGIEKIITIAVSPDNLKKVRDLCQSHENVFGSQGVHPHDAKSFDPNCLQEIQDHLSSEKILAVGEIGLDYYYEHSDREIQKKVFEQQLQLAADNDYPVIIHTRDAEEDTLRILQQEMSKHSFTGLIHCFTASQYFADAVLELGLYISLSGIVTFKNARELQEITKTIPLDRLLVETDAPYLAPVPHRGKRNEPAFTRHTAEFLADLKGIPFHEFAKITTQNAQQVFHLPAF